MQHMTKVLASIGALLSLYALYVENRTHEDDEFVALCDIDRIGASCSQVFQLPQGRLLSYIGLIPEEHALDVPNAALGFCFYLLMLASEIVTIPAMVIQLAVLMAFSSSVFLAYILATIRELCVLCLTTHVINSCLLYIYILRGGKGAGKEKTH
mmetsp:Transcript_59150/g.70578  ORF Transcript_59150/g.70578 Transcript_59150/m.70578 type:complete len:154 (-) Transcript_59150:35-496(-)